MAFGRELLTIPDPAEALPGRREAMPVPEAHEVNGRPLRPPFPDGLESVVVGMGCFWGAERAFWQTPGVWTTAVGYSGGHTPNPTYREVCSGLTGHAEVVLVVFDPEALPIGEVLQVFWENHDPTQGMGQGNDLGTQYRSGVWAATDTHRAAAEAGRAAYTTVLAAAGYGPVTSEVTRLGEFFYAEDYHQQYLAKNPMGYCGMGGTGLACPAAPAGKAAGEPNGSVQELAGDQLL